MKTTNNKLTKEQFLDNINNEEFKDLYSNIIEAGGVDWEELIESLEDFRDPSTGSVPGLIHYSDTEKFAKENIEDLLYLYTNYIEETGAPLEIGKGSTPLNWFAWFAWESMIWELSNQLEQKEE